MNGQIKLSARLVTNSQTEIAEQMEHFSFSGRKA